MALPAHLAQQLAVIARLDLAEAIGVLLDQVDQVAHELAALAPGRRRPVAFVERQPGGTHRPVDVIG